MLRPQLLAHDRAGVLPPAARAPWPYRAPCRAQVAVGRARAQRREGLQQLLQALVLALCDRSQTCT